MGRKISAFSTITASGLDSAADSIPLIDASAADASKNKRIVIDELQTAIGSGLVLDADPTDPLGAATKQYVDDSSGGGSTGRHTIWVPAVNIAPLLTGGCATGLAETSSEKNLLKTLDFDSSSTERAQFEIAMPKSWDKGNIAFKVYWSHASTTVNFGVRWELHCNSFDPDADLDQTVSGFVGSSDTGGATNTLYVTDETDPLEVDDPFSGIPTTIDNALLIFRILRFPAHADDTLAIDARLHGIQVYYNADAGSDD